MKIDDGYIQIHISDEILGAPGVLEECGKHTAFNRYFFEGVVQLMLTDEVQWEPDENPWWTSISFGRSEFEEARMKLLERLPEAALTQVKKFQKERDTYEKYYRDYLSKCHAMENTVHELRNQIRILKIEAKETHEDTHP